MLLLIRRWYDPGDRDAAVDTAMLDCIWDLSARRWDEMLDPSSAWTVCRSTINFTSNGEARVTIMSASILHAQTLAMVI